MKTYILDNRNLQHGVFSFTYVGEYKHKRSGQAAAKRLAEKLCLHDFTVTHGDKKEIKKGFDK